MLCASVALVVACVVGALLALGCGVVAHGDAPHVCLVCGRRWLCVGEVPVWWVWCPPWVLGVGCWAGVGARLDTLDGYFVGSGYQKNKFQKFYCLRHGTSNRG